MSERLSHPSIFHLGISLRACFAADHPQEHSDQDVVLAIVDSFAKNHVPLAALTLEPPWQTHAYACTYVWNRDMFWDPPGFIDTLASKNISLTLWEHGYVYNGTTPTHRHRDSPAPITAGGQNPASPLFMPLLENDCT